MIKSKAAAKPHNPFWDTVPFSSAVLFFGGVFCTFAAVGVVPDLVRLGTLPRSTLALACIVSGLFAIGYAYTAIHGRWIFFPLIFITQGLFYGRFHTVAPFAVGRSLPVIDPGTTTAGLLFDSILIVAFIVLAYVLFIAFFNREGSRYFKAHTEIALAKEIHQQLVPRIEQQVDGFQFYGVSVPSGEVGGDLVDVTAKDGRWLAYIVDVSGHGVSSGVLMAMVKSATRMKPGFDTAANALMADINQVIFDLKKSNMFVTAACLRLKDQNTLEYSLAGHLPILHYRCADGTVTEIANHNVPLGMFAEMPFLAGETEIASGDTMLLITDGLTETANGKGDEFGLERLKHYVTANARRSPKELVDGLMNIVQQHGKQDDDRSVLVVKRI